MQPSNGLEQGPWWIHKASNVTLMVPGLVMSLKGLHMLRALVSLSESRKGVLDAIRTAVKIKLQSH